MCEVTRREWLGQCLSAAGAVFVVQLPPQFSTPATPACEPGTLPTPARPASGFRPGAPVSRTIGAPRPDGLAVTLSGAVIGLRCGLIPNATVDFWSGDARGRQQTDAGGRYRATVIVPRPASSTGSVRAPRLNLRVDVPGKATLTTWLFLPDEIAHAQNAADPQFDELLRMKLVGQTRNAIDASFNVILDL
jgi:protocatechuate 3,4-dioxygenase beta subunit